MADIAADGRRPWYRDWRDFIPKTYSTLVEGYGFASLRADVFAGLTVAIVALPLAMALAIASGTTPEKGLITAAVAGFLISALGGSRYQIGGPTGAFVVVVFNVIHAHGFDGLVFATLMAGVLLLIAGVARLGSWIRYIPEPVVAGFTAGIAIIIATSQVRDLAGLVMTAPPADFLAKWAAMWDVRATFSPPSLAVAAAAIALILVLRRYAPKWPAFLIAVVVSALAVALLNLPIDTIGSRFGQLPAGLPAPAIPEISWARFSDLLPSALTIAFLAGVESLLSAMVADGMTGRRHRSNGELVAQGVANIASSLFGGMPATGAIARTATNIRAGAKSPVAGMLHAVFVLGFLAAGAPLAGYVPLASLAAILIIVAWTMAEPHKLVFLLRAPWGERSVLLVTLVLTVLVDLTVAISAGVVMGAMVFMHRMAEAANIARGDEMHAHDPEPRETQRDLLPPGVEVFQVRGPLFFGAAMRIEDMLETIIQLPRAVIIRLSQCPVADATGAGVLQDFVARCRKSGVRVILSGVPEQPAAMLASLGLGPDDGVVEYAENYAAALALAR